MKVKMFNKMLGEDYDKMYEELTQEEKYTAELLGLMTLRGRSREREKEIQVSQEIYVDPNKNKLKARYIVEVPIV